MDVSQIKDKSRDYSFGYIYGRKFIVENKSVDQIEKVIEDAKLKNAEMAEGLADGVYSKLTESFEMETKLNEISDPVIKKLLEGKPFDSDVNPWMQLQFINANLPENDELTIKAEEIYRAMEDGKIDEETAKQRLGNVVMLAQNKLWGK